MYAGLVLFCLTLIIPVTVVKELDIVPDEGTIILSSVPNVRQSTGYSCGAASLQAVLNYWGIDKPESILIQLLGTSPASGTAPEQIVAVASSLGLDASLSEDLEINDLKESVESGIPIIIAAQAWEGYDNNGVWVSITPENWEDIREDGHYMVVIGVDNRNVYLEDPSLLGTRGVIPIDEFISRWHYHPPCSDSTRQRTGYHHLGIIIRGEKPAQYMEYSLVR